ncbi:MAG: UDP-3-O-(3-hydroxymyristoyl)glucosamine N-acyltransferase [Hyphomicrobiales bacterium]|nr:MAG: UDP-3-O-(3-hydroxymyristoyl)glucosamine N-acyltransferase [Hyphomicrobiales bacterium]
MNDPEFFKAPDPVSIETICEWTSATMAEGDPATVIRGVAALDLAAAGDLTFIDNPRYLPLLAETGASACFAPKKFVDKIPSHVIALEAKDPYRAFATVMTRFYPAATKLRGVCPEQEGISPRAHVDDQARLETGVIVEPGAVVGPDAEIGTGTVIAANAVVGAGVRIGRDCYIGPNTTVQFALLGNRVFLHPGVCVGQDGFGFAMGPGGHSKVPQIGRVVIQDDVEIGANTTIDRGANRDTIIGEGTKIDNQVQIGHNVVVGRHCVIVAQVGISGSTQLEDYVVLAGKVGLAGHLKIGMGAQIGGSSNVNDDVPSGQRWIGSPAKPLREWTREQSALKALVRNKAAKGDDSGK